MLLVSFLVFEVVEDLADLCLRHLFDFNFICFSTAMGESYVSLTLDLRRSYWTIGHMLIT